MCNTCIDTLHLPEAILSFPNSVAKQTSNAFSSKKECYQLHVFLISALIFIVFISLLWSDSQSLIAHDEGLCDEQN